MLRLVLASASPRRRELLTGLGLTFEVRAARVDEPPLPGELPAAMVERLARQKALASAAVGEADHEMVLAADTTVVIDGLILGKPVDQAEAVAMLAQLAGRTHEVLSAVAVVTPAGQVASVVDRTLVTMASLDAAQIRWYVATGEPMDKAGAYAIQGLGALLVETIAGSYTNVVGLPLPATARLVASVGYELLAFRDDAA